MTEEIQNKVLGYIDAIAEKLGVATELVLGILIKQQVTQGIVDLFTAIVVFVLTFIAIKVITKLTIKTRNEIKDHNEKNKDSYYNKKDWMDYPHVIIPSVVVGVILTIATLVMTLGVVPTAIMKIVNPEYYALKEILSVFG